MISSIKDLHAVWAKAVMPPNVSQVQRQEMERAFYSGFCSALNCLMLEVSAISDEEGVRACEALLRECETYFKTLSKAPVDIPRN